MYLSKSQFTKGLQCVKALWLKKYKKEALTPPDEAQMAIFESGNVVGDLACDLFPGGKEIPFDRENMNSMAPLTKKYLDEGVKDIYEATFEFNGIFVMVDILHKGEDGWEIYEVKSSTLVKDVNIADAAIQYYALEGCGLNISKASIVHINNEYIRGKDLEIDKLFTIADVTDEVIEFQTTIPDILEHFEKILRDRVNEPDIDIGMHCSSPYTCDAKDYCWNKQKKIPEYSIFDISRLNTKKKFELYEEGIIEFDDIDSLHHFSDSQRVQIDCEIDDKTIIDRDEIKNFVNNLTYPLYHLDFETFQQVIPQYEGLKPYQQIPSQFSLHIEYGNGGLDHKEFLAVAGSDPRRALAEKLVEDIPKDVMLLAYNKGFEKGVIKRLAEIYPDISDHLMAIHDNIKDLMTPFQRKFYYTPSMKGSYSIKKVMPALVPDMVNAYKELEVVHDGGEAMNIYAGLHLIKDDAEVTRIRNGLLEYCKLDTLAMVKILERLREVVD